MEINLVNIFDGFNSLQGQYYRLAVILVSSDEQTDRLIQSLPEQTQAAVININMELSKRLFEIPENRLALMLHKELNELLKSNSENLLVLRNIEILFHPLLKQNVLQLLKYLSRTYTIITFWDGSFKDNKLIYAQPDHPEYQEANLNDIHLYSILDEKITQMKIGGE